METAQTPPNETPEQADIRINKDVAAFSYVWIMSVIIYFSRKDSSFIRYHSKQGIILFLLSIPVSLIPGIGSYLMFIVVAGMLLGFLNAANGQMRDVPLVGPLSRGEMSLSDVLHILMNWLKKVVASTKKPQAKPETGSVTVVSTPPPAVDTKTPNPIP
ncbi:hypothetical protein EXS65_01610 [Candidatus Peribacteria bacterium]|nr:hypothetical protein [Candidatus Peribacteria bacterium]